MAQKAITDLQLRELVSDDLNFPSDDGIQSYRVTGNQIKDFVLDDGNVAASALAANAVTTAKILDANVTLAKLAAAVQNALVPVGTVQTFAGTVAPSGFLLCDGQAVSRSTYSALFSLIGTTYGAGDGSTTFNLPSFDALNTSWSPEFTPTIANVGSATFIFNVARWRREGRNIRIRWKARTSAAGSGGAQVSFLLPNSLEYDDSIISSTNTFDVNLGNANIGANGAHYALLIGSSLVNIYFSFTGSQLTSSTSVGAEFSVPIDGWVGGAIIKV